MSKTHHNINTHPSNYRAIERGELKFVIDTVDNDYQKYDILHLQEYCGGEYTGREIVAQVTFVLKNPVYSETELVIMSINVLNICS